MEALTSNRAKKVYWELIHEIDVYHETVMEKILSLGSVEDERPLVIDLESMCLMNRRDALTAAMNIELEEVRIQATVGVSMATIQEQFNKT